MATTTQIFTALHELSEYYGKEPGRDKTKLYLETLSDLDPEALKYAVRAWIKKSPFFPRVNELRQLAYEYQVPLQDELADRYERMHEAFFVRRELDIAAWQALAKEFVRSKRYHRALNTRKKLRLILDIVRREEQ